MQYRTQRENKRKREGERGIVEVKSVWAFLLIL